MSRTYSINSKRLRASEDVKKVEQRLKTEETKVLKGGGKTGMK